MIWLRRGDDFSLKLILSSGTHKQMRERDVFSTSISLFEPKEEIRVAGGSHTGDKSKEDDALGMYKRVEGRSTNSLNLMSGATPA